MYLSIYPQYAGKTLVYSSISDQGPLILVTIISGVTKTRNGKRKGKQNGTGTKIYKQVNHLNRTEYKLDRNNVLYKVAQTNFS